VHCRRFHQGLCGFAVEGCLVLIVLALPLVTSVGCVTAEEALLAQGEELLSRQEYEAASLLFTRYIQLCPDAPGGYFARGIANRELGKRRGAEADFAKAILLNPNSTYFRWARFKILQGRYESLQSSATTTLERPVSETLRSALSTLMMQDLERILQLDPQDISARLEYASLLSLRGSLEEAMTELDSSVLEAPFDAGVRNERGRLLHEMGRYADAIKDYDVALQYCDSCALVKYNRALSLKKCGRIEEAVAAFQEVVAEDSLDGGAWLNLGELQHMIGRRDDGCVSLRTSMTLGIPEARDLYEELCR
jgi:tetratricopeptide (TPR) repeat protein